MKLEHQICIGEIEYSSADVCVTALNHTISELNFLMYLSVFYLMYDLFIKIWLGIFQKSGENSG